VFALNIDGVNGCLIDSRLGTSELPEPEKYEIRQLDPRDWNHSISTYSTLYFPLMHV
jgi:hypothetical protein